MIKPSFFAFLQEARRSKNFGWKEFLHGWLYIRFPYLYISIGTGEHPLARRWGAQLASLVSKLIGTSASTPTDRLLQAPTPDRHLPVGPDGHLNFADTYHGKVVPLPAARQLVSVREDVRIENLEKIIPYALARDIILKNPDHIVALECPCRAARAHPCLPLDVCLIIGEPFASYIIEHQTDRARWITQAEAAQILEAEDKRGHVHHAFFKDAMLGRFYAICNCCACCCGAMQAQRNNTPMLTSSGYVAQVDEALCQACGTCQEHCQFEALSIDLYSRVNMDICMGCGVCAGQCPEGAIKLVPAPARGEPLEIFTLMNQARNN